MDLYIDRDALARGLARVQGIIERRSTHQLLSHVLLKADEAGLQMTATDQEVAYIGQLEANVSKPGEVAVHAANLFQIIRSMPESTIHLSMGSARRLEIRSGRAEFRLPGRAASEFPVLPAFDSKSEVKLTEGALRRMVECTQFAVAVDDVRTGLNGVHLEEGTNEEGPVLRFVATDGHRLSSAESGYEGSLSLSANMLVPRKALAVLKKLLDRDEEQVVIGFGDGVIRVNREGETFWFRMLEGKFPDYESVVPKDGKQAALIRTDLLTSTLKRVALVAPDRGRKAVKFEFCENELNIEVHNVERGEITESVEMEYDGTTMAVGFNPKYLLEILSVVRGDVVSLELAHPLAPCKVSDPQEPNVFFIAMPMRLD